MAGKTAEVETLKTAAREAEKPKMEKPKSFSPADLIGKVETLMQLHHELREENRQLSLVNRNLNFRIEEQKNRIKELENKTKVLQIAKSLEGNGPDQNSRQLKNKINEYIREIDKCLALLHK